MDLATRTQRFLAILLDSVLISGVFAIAAYEGTPDPVRFLGLAAGAAIFAANLFFLARAGQTLGKKAVGIRIVLADSGLNGGFVVNVLKRGALAGVPYFALTFLHPVAGAAYVWADVLCVFRDSRRCLHDQIAGTVVIRSGEPVSSVV